MSSGGQDAAGQGVASGSGLSLREKMRLKVQQKLQDQADSTAASSSGTDPASLIAMDVDSYGRDDDEVPGSLTLNRPKRKAALDRPATYSIDPTDDASRLKRHPNRLPASLAHYGATPVRKSKGIEGLLREQQRRHKRGTDADGFSKADEIARSMEQERLGRMGIAYSDDDSDGQLIDPRYSKPGTSKVRPAQVSSSRNAYGIKGKEQELTVRELSPTIPSFLWSSQSEASDSGDDMDVDNDAAAAKHRLAASLAAVGADEEQKQLAFDILQKDVGQEKGDNAERSKNCIPFYRSSKILRPKVSFFCPSPSVTDKPKAKDMPTTQASQQSLTAAELEWETRARHILPAGFLPPALELDKRQVRSILLWLAFAFVLEHDIIQSRLISSLLGKLLDKQIHTHYDRERDWARPKAMTDVIDRIPRLLIMIGMNESMFEASFPDDCDVLDVPCFTLSQRRENAIATSAETALSKMHLTQIERDVILSSLARLLDIAVRSKPHPTFVADHLSFFAGYVSSMAIACAASTSFELQNEMGVALHSIFAAAAHEEGEDTLRKLQEEVCRRTFSALGMDSLVVRARLVAALPGEGREVGAVRRWLAWCALTEHVARAEMSAAASPYKDLVPSSDPMADDNEDNTVNVKETAHWRRTKFNPLTIDLEMLALTIDSDDPGSPFYIAPAAAREESKASATSTTDMQSLIAATQLVALALRDLPIHMCTFSPACTDGRTTPTPSNPNPQPVDRKGWPRALRNALSPLLPLHPTLEPTRIAALQTIVKRLTDVNSRIRDDRGNVILQTLAKDRLHSTALLLEYQLGMYAGDAGVGGSFIR